jgi:amino acid transporter
MPPGEVDHPAISAPDPPVSSTPEPSLRATLGTRDITFFAIACIVGTRWIAAAAHAGTGSILLWLIGAVCFGVPLAVCVAALTIRHPRAGGIYIWTRHDFGPWHGFLCFWLYWMSVVIWFPGAAMFYAGAALGFTGPTGAHLNDGRLWIVVASLSLIWIALAPGVFGVKASQRTADLGAIGAWALAALFGVAAFVFLRRHPSATTFHLLPENNWNTVNFFATIAFAMSGMDLIGLMGAEIRDPKRSLPRAAWISSPVVLLFYAGATAAILVMLRPDQVSELQGLSQAGNAAALALGTPWLQSVIALLVFSTAVGQFGGLGSSISRLPFAAGVDGLMPRAFGKIHHRWNTPYISILTLGALASALLLLMQLGDSARAAYDTIVSLMLIVTFIPYVYLFGSAWKTGNRMAAAMGMGVTSLAIVCSLVPPDGVTHPLIFEGKLALGTVACVVSAWFIYRRRAADSSSNVMSPG